MIKTRALPLALAFAVSALAGTTGDALALAAPLAKGPTRPVVAPSPPAPVTAPYDAELKRLTELLGSVSYLRQLCKAKDGEDFRAAAEHLIELDASDNMDRKQHYIAAFNRGYRAFASLYSDCTAAAVVAEGRYRNEGATLAAEIAARFGN